MKNLQVNFVRYGTAWMMAALITAAATDSLATSLNIDFYDNSPGVTPISPGSTYGGAANQAGTWNAIPGKDGVYGSPPHAAPQIVDLAGTILPGVVVDLGGADFMINPQTNPSTLSGNDAALVNDGFVTSNSGTPWILQISGITNGKYTVTAYGVPSISTSAWTFGNSPTTQIELTANRPPPSSPPGLILNQDYVVAQTVVAGNVLILQSGIISGGGTAGSGLAGLQIEFVAPVPIPAALPLFFSTLAALGFFGWRGRQAIA